MTEPNNRWHLDKRVSVGHLITTAVMLASIALWLVRLEGRINLADNNIQNMTTRVILADLTSEKRDSEIIRRLERIEDLLAEHERSSTK